MPSGNSSCLNPLISFNVLDCVIKSGVDSIIQNLLTLESTIPNETTFLEGSGFLNKLEQHFFVQPICGDPAS